MKKITLDINIFYVFRSSYCSENISRPFRESKDVSIPIIFVDPSCYTILFWYNLCSFLFLSQKHLDECLLETRICLEIKMNCLINWINFYAVILFSCLLNVILAYWNSTTESIVCWLNWRRFTNLLVYLLQKFFEFLSNKKVVKSKKISNI